MGNFALLYNVFVLTGNVDAAIKFCIFETASLDIYCPPLLKSNKTYFVLFGWVHTPNFGNSVPI